MLRQGWYQMYQPLIPTSLNNMPPAMPTLPLTLPLITDQYVSSCQVMSSNLRFDDPKSWDLFKLLQD